MDRLAEILERARAVGARLRVTVGRAGAAQGRPGGLRLPAVKLPPPPRFKLGQFVPVVRRVG